MDLRSDMAGTFTLVEVPIVPTLAILTTHQVGTTMETPLPTHSCTGVVINTLHQTKWKYFTKQLKR